MQPYMVNIKLSARTLTGALNPQNRGAADWGWQGLIAYGCHSLVLVIDSKTAQTLQVLERHKANVVKVKWAKENYHHNIGSPYSLRLASADATGKIIVWDVATGAARCEIQEHTKPIQDMQWLWNQDASRDLLLAVHPPNYIVLWNADTGTKLWKKSYAENILSFSFDPFDPSNLTLLTSEGIVFISDFSPSKAPVSSGKKVYISSPRSSPVHNKLVSAAGAKKALDKVKILITNEKPSLLQEAESKSELSQNISAREHFVFTDTDGQVYHLTVEGNSVKDSARIPPDGSMGSITCIAWKGDILVLGDVDGNLNFWDLKARVSRGIPTHRGWVRKIRFAPGKGNQKLIAMYNDGAEVWDTKEVQMVNSLRTGRNVNFRVLDVDWCTSDKVILASDDGCIRVLEMTMKSACFRMDEQELTEPVWCPYLLVPRASLALKAFLLHQPWNNKYSLDISHINYPENENVKNLLQEQLNSLSNDIRKLLLDPEFTLLQRCLLVSRLYGDESELHFWTAAAHYLHTFSRGKPLTVKAEDTMIPQGKWISPLDICYDILCENSYFQKFQLERVNLQEVKRSNYDHTKKCTDQLLLLGQTDRAVQLLLETSSENPYYYCDSLKACLVTTVTSSGPSQSTIKLVATNMIANGKLAEGVQLLCLIDKAADACRYLQTYGEWNRAAWLAKVRLNPEECADVFKRWVDHLCSPQINQKSKAILVLLSLGCFVRVAEMLHSMRYFDRAALFVEACLNYGTIEVNEDSKKLIHAIFADYARSLKTLGFKQAATLFASKAGPAGKDLLNELEQLKEEE
uniref:WD repeat domain 11 n=1 Tax=Podarcis muralis TaxID=64176 RepID=A0A670ID34_PODMU